MFAVAARMKMLLTIEMLSVHDATTNMAQRLRDAKSPDEAETYGNLYTKLARTFTTQVDTLQRWNSGPEPKVTVQTAVSVSDGGQAIVGNVIQNNVEKDKTEIAQSSPLVSDQSGMSMPIIEADEQSAAMVPRIEQDQQPSPSAAKRKRRA